MVRRLKWIPAFAGIAVLLFAYSAIAEDETPVTYSPAPCDFSVTFPSSPYTARKCDDEDKTKCYDMTSYTKVYDMASTVNFRVICNKIDESVYKHYSAEVMEATLRAMTNRTVVQTFDTTFRTEDNYKQAALIGEGQSGILSTIYIAQLWIGHGSALSVEAEMIGEAHDDADKLLSDVLKSVHYLTDEERKAKLPKDKEADEDKDAEKEDKDDDKKEESKEEKPEEKKAE
ncbi:MAG: hypothetical protein KA155_04105 [Alphaproteobacteria bacterium]|nr:hypothetical protein [Alphaproteobacteria bacterium]